MQLLCGSINVRERLWASKRQPIDYRRCCTDRLNAPPESGRWLLPQPSRLRATRRHPPSSLRRSRPLTRQRNDELRKHTGFGLVIDPPPVLFHNDVMGHREPQPCPFPGRFGSEEGVEHLLPYLGRNTRAVVENANFDGLAEISRDRAKDRLKVPIGCLCFAFCRCIEAVG